MENATKALIIAGAILVAILIVTMGIRLLSNTSGMNDSAGNVVDQASVQQFNGRLETGIGNNVTGSNVIAMLEAAAAMLREDPNLELQIDLPTARGGSAATTDDLSNGTGTMGTSTTAEDIIAAESFVVRTAKYKVTYTKDGASGYINHIRIVRI